MEFAQTGVENYCRMVSRASVEEQVELLWMDPGAYAEILEPALTALEEVRLMGFAKVKRLMQEAVQRCEYCRFE